MRRDLFSITFNFIKVALSSARAPRKAALGRAAEVCESPCGFLTDFFLNHVRRAALSVERQTALWRPARQFALCGSQPDALGEAIPRCHITAREVEEEREGEGERDEDGDIKLCVIVPVMLSRSPWKSRVNTAAAAASSSPNCSCRRKFPRHSEEERG